MKTQQSGFTLIELVMVIVILGILAATAVPAMTGLDSSARTAATQGIAGSLGSASAINFAVRTVNSSNGVAVTTCAAVANALEGGLDANYSISWKSGDAEPMTSGQTATCTVTRTSGETADFVAQAIP
jgi:MSHA pilin protein MshA